MLRTGISPDRGNGTDEEKLFVIVTDLLRGGPAPPALRPALWQIAAGLPGSTLTPRAVDGIGRTGTPLDHADEWGRYRMVVDPQDGALLEIGAVPGWSFRSTFLVQGPAQDTPIEPTLEMSGCLDWATC